MEFKDYVRIVRAHWVGVVLSGRARCRRRCRLTTSQQPKVYQATATGYVLAGKSHRRVGRFNQQLARSRAKVTSYVAIATSTKTAQQVIDDAKYPEFAGATPSSLIGNISVSQPLDTVLIDISARGSSPEAAQHLADAWVTALSEQIAQLEGTTNTTSGIHLESYWFRGARGEGPAPDQPQPRSSACCLACCWASPMP